MSEKRINEKKISVRKQKVKKNHIREKLIFFTALTVILLIIAVFARKSVRMIHMHRIFCRHRKLPQRNIFWERTDTEEICSLVYW